MSEVVRLYQYKGLLGGRRAMSAGEITTKLEISAATFKRDLAKLRDQLHMPIRFDRDLGGYVLDGADKAIVIANPALTAIKCQTPEQMALVNLLCWVVDNRCK